VSLGADRNTYELPHDLVIVQVGDLVHQGPDAEGVMHLVQQISDHQPAQWIRGDIRWCATPPDTAACQGSGQVGHTHIARWTTNPSSSET